MSLGEAIIIMFRLLRGVLRPQVLYTKLVLMGRSVFTYPGRSFYRFVQILRLVLRLQVLYSKLVLMGRAIFIYLGRTLDQLPD